MSASYIIREKDTKRVLFETFNKTVVNRLNLEKYEAIPILEYLEKLNSDIKRDK
jgi:hypothetical protein